LKELKNDAFYAEKRNKPSIFMTFYDKKNNLKANNKASDIIFIIYDDI